MDISKQSPIKSTVAVLLVIVFALCLTAGIVFAATTRDITATLGGQTGDSFDLNGTFIVNSLKVGAQGTGGVTFFNGTIINNTTGSQGADNPVTFGDNVRIDGRIYRGAEAGISDNQPLIVNDNLEVMGDLDLHGTVSASKVSFDNDGTNLDADTVQEAVVEVAGQDVVRKVYTGAIDLDEEGDITSRDEFSVDCDEYPDAQTANIYHFRAISIPEVDIENMPEIIPYTRPAEANLDVMPTENVWVEMYPYYEDGSAYILYKVVQENCDGSDGATWYYSNGDYKIVLLYK